MLSKHSYDVLVIGGGTAGLRAAEAARSFGASVCLIEQGKLGGRDANDVTVPVNAFSNVASFYHSLTNAKRFGIAVSAATFQFADVMRYKDQVVEAITGGGRIGDRFEKRFSELGIDFVSGFARFEDEHLVSVSGEQIYGKAIVLATGSEEIIPDVKGLKTIPFLRAKDLFSKTRQPKSIGIIGGGAVACEIASLFALFGTRVVLLEQQPHILPDEDEECVRLIDDALQRLGVEISTNARITEIVDGRGGVYGIKVDVRGVSSMHAVEHVVLADQLQAKTSGLFLELAGLACETNGFLSVTKEQKTHLPHVFAAGDVTSISYSSRVAGTDGEIAGINAARFALQKKTKPDLAEKRFFPYVISVQPEFARVGMNVAEVKKRFGNALVGRCDVSKLEGAALCDERCGFVQLIAHPKTRKLLGAEWIGVRAGECIQECVLALALNTTVDKLAATPTVSFTVTECVRMAASNLILES